MRKGFFISIEGCDGSGKSFHSRRLASALKELGYDVILTREPGGTPTAEKIREIVLSKDNNMFQRTELLLYTAARIEHFYGVIEPSLRRGAVVVCDRYIDSTFAYQGFGGGIDNNTILQLFELTTPEGWPDLTLFLDIGPGEAFFRKGGVDQADRQELKGFEFHQRVYEGFVSLSKQYPERIARIDASGDKEQTAKQILERVLSRLSKAL